MSPTPRLLDLIGKARASAEPILKESFTGYYRWHAKRTLHEITTARGAKIDGALVGVALTERLVPQVGYVYYVFVGTAHRRQGIGALLLDDALSRFRRDRVAVVYSVAESEHGPSYELLCSRGFRPVARKELGWAEGGLGAWGLRSRMRIIGGEVLLGRRLEEPEARAKERPRRRSPDRPERARGDLRR
jgi:ribosomal protein S18 acetylase RimI-like enzyme